MNASKSCDKNADCENTVGSYICVTLVPTSPYSDAAVQCLEENFQKSKTLKTSFLYNSFELEKST